MCAERRIMKQPMSPAGFADVDRTSDPEFYVRTLDHTTPIWHALRERVDAALAVRAGAHILDVGCGTGEAARELARRVGGGRVVGVDRSRTMVAEARKRAEGSGLPVEFRTGDVYRLDFADNTFDGCRAERLFAHLARPGQALAEMCRVARAGGRVVVASVDAETLVLDAPDRALTRRILNHWCDTRTVNGWIGRQLPRLFRCAGLTDVTVSPVTVVTERPAESGTFGIRDHAERARVAGAVSAAEAATWLRSLEEASRAGHFFAAATAFVVSGREPA
jgi:ubiquinone/menaquinone biosynthesis C-methylase UbiE